MQDLTAKELELISDALTAEGLICKKARAYSKILINVAVRGKIARVHRNFVGVGKKFVYKYGKHLVASLEGLICKKARAYSKILTDVELAGCMTKIADEHEQFFRIFSAQSFDCELQFLILNKRNILFIYFVKHKDSRRT